MKHDETLFSTIPFGPPAIVCATESLSNAPEEEEDKDAEDDNGAFDRSVWFGELRPLFSVDPKHTRARTSGG